MKWQPRQLENHTGAWPALILVYGEDSGKCKHLARHAALQINPHLDDPFAVDRLRAEDLLDDPTKLVDSAGMMSFGVDTRLVFVEGVNSTLPAAQLTKITDAVKMALDNPHYGSVIVMAAAGVDNKHALAKYVEKHDAAAAIRCFLSSASDLQAEIRHFFEQHGKKLAPDVLPFLLENLGNDREVTQRELEVLLAYMGDETTITLVDCMETISSAPSMNVFKLCDAIGMRDRKTVDRYLTMLQEEGQDLTMVLSLVLRHLRRLMQAQALMTQGKTPDAAMSALKPPVFFGKREFGQQLHRYPAARLKNLAERAYQLQLESRQGIVSSDFVIRRALLGFAF